MTLQGDLQSFSLPDVLRLLAGTGKSGRLAVSATDRSGDIWLDGGSIVAGAVSSAPHAVEAADVVFEVLRFDGGTFTFLDDEEPADRTGSATVDEAIGRAEELVQEWAEVEQVVPSLQSWVTFAPEIAGDHASVSSDQWRTLAALGGGLTVKDLGDHFEQTDLVMSRRVKELVEAGLVELGDAPADAPRREPAGPPAAADAAPERDDLSVLRADDGPVVIETSEDALLPEPLPNESTSFAGDLDAGAVDGRPDAIDDSFDDELDTDQDSGDTDDDGFDPVGGDDDHGIVFGEPDLPSRVSGGGEPDASPSESSPFDSADDFFGAGDDSQTSDTDADPLASTPSTDAASGAAGGGDDDRGALLDFLSSVKP